MEIKFSFFASETLGVNTNGKETGAISLSFGQMNWKPCATSVKQMTEFSGCVSLISNITLADSKFANIKMITILKASILEPKTLQKNMNWSPWPSLKPENKPFLFHRKILDFTQKTPKLNTVNADSSLLK